jgi:hypothetical protein
LRFRITKRPRRNGRQVGQQNGRRPIPSATQLIRKASRSAECAGKRFHRCECATHCFAELRHEFLRLCISQIARDLVQCPRFFDNGAAQNV